MTRGDNTGPNSWAFRSRFRRGGFGWKGSRLAIERINEAVSEIKAVARYDLVAAAEGSVLFLEKLSPSLSEVDSSSGALGNAAYAAVQTLVPLISGAAVSDAQRMKWLDRLFDAIQEDDPPYIESLGDHWGELCSSPALASEWVDRLLPCLKNVQRERQRGTFAFFSGAGVCYSALFKAGRHDELLQLLETTPPPIWPYLVWGGRVLAARGQIDEAIAYVTERAGVNTHEVTIARFAEDLLLKANRRGEAFNRYALLANQSNSNLSTYRGLAKKYPELDPKKLLTFLISSTPGEPGKWFATAKTLKLYDLASELAMASPCDPKTLIRAATAHMTSRPEFAMNCALAALHWISLGHGYEMSGWEVRDAHRMAMDAAATAGQSELAQARIGQVLAHDKPMTARMKQGIGIP